MGCENETRILQIGPALRGLLAKGGTLPSVTFSHEPSAAGYHRIDVAVAADTSDEEVVATLRAALKKAGPAVSEVVVPEVGTFTVAPVDVETSGRVDGKVAVVTGAAQGFGLEIAQDMAAQGAVVVLADINIDAARTEAQKIAAQYGPHRALALALNVTDPASIRAALVEVVKTCGGLDVFVSNAGVLKAESVKTQALKDFRFVTDVNYLGYFLCVQQAAPILARQHAANAAYTSDIIQINSKSGLEGSNRNGAYAGSKFGGIGLTQSFAMELVEDGIKVNAICPGNFFDGPLWSDPDNGLFMQYLRTGKIPGARTVAEVKAAYEAKVPMGRGCTTADVMKAVYYLIDQQYETGQAVPVTGGQVMLH